MVLQTFLADLNVVLLVEPLDDCVLDLAHALKVCEVLLKLVTVWSHVFDSVVIADVLLVGQWLKDDRPPLNRGHVHDTHQRHDCHRYFNIIFCTNLRDRDRV